MRKYMVSSLWSSMVFIWIRPTCGLCGGVSDFEKPRKDEEGLVAGEGSATLWVEDRTNGKILIMFVEWIRELMPHSIAISPHGKYITLQPIRTIKSLSNSLRLGKTELKLSQFHACWGWILGLSKLHLGPKYYTNQLLYHISEWIAPNFLSCRNAPLSQSWKFVLYSYCTAHDFWNTPS